ncbi:hypothetical protein SAMN05660976_07931 [Nonomuraea pusilla]|uniref:Phage integrase family protein n=1 Tax=Nonomuraea pusilla TaxID=46177 RepID=A0A1H8I1P5_9ACTN|nr:hypothetical protein SAMN05660976_07931 [Nonomuraea pusilla]
MVQEFGSFGGPPEVVTYVGRSRGPVLAAMFACMYFGGLRPAEAAGLRQKDCHLPEQGWGLLTLEKTRPQSNKRFTDSGQTHDERGLKHRDVKQTRTVPIPPELVVMLRDHIARFGVGGDGRLFRTRTGGVISGSAYAKVWQEARTYALTPDQVASPLAGRPYDLRTRPSRSGSTRACTLRKRPNGRDTAWT